MYTVFVIGNIASGKSLACKYLQQLGGYYIDLDELAKGLYFPGSPVVDELAQEFGVDILSETEGINRALLASRAFSSPENAEVLNSIVHPYVREELSKILVSPCCVPTDSHCAFTVVEVSVPAAVFDLFNLADDIVAISVPYEIRRARAIFRGMSSRDFECRAAAQPSDSELESMASVVIDNSGTVEELQARLRALLIEKGISYEG